MVRFTRLRMSKMRNKTIESQRLVDIGGKTVKVTKLKPKRNRSKKYARHTVTSCPNCLSTLKLNEVGVWDCTGDRLQIWVSEFEKFDRSTESQKKEYLLNLSESNRFLDLYSKWKFQDESGNRPNFNCGYTNEVYPPMSKIKTRIPDPAFCKSLERRLGRELTEEEKANEVEIWEWQGIVSTEKRAGAKKIRIPWITLPEDDI